MLSIQLQNKQIDPQTTLTQSNACSVRCPEHRLAKNRHSVADQMGLWVKTPATEADNLGSIPGTRMGEGQH